MNKSEVIAFHGWGFDASCWDSWKKDLGDDIEFSTFERGYFGAVERNPVFSETEGAKILMCHSFGLHQCPNILFEETDMLVIFNGFMQFHPVAAQYRRRSKLVLKQMMNKLQGEARRVLNEFYSNSYYPLEPAEMPSGEINDELLLEDLERLNTHVLEVSYLKSIHKICILHGFNDAVVHRRKGRAIYEHFPEQAKYFEIKNAGHALPFTHLQQCRQFIEPELQELTSR